MGNGSENCAIVTVQKVVRDVSQVKIKAELKVLRTFSQYWRKKNLWQEYSPIVLDTTFVCVR